MTNKIDYSQLIEDYLKGAISPSDKIELENQMAKDPALKSEFDFQKDIVDVIRESRRIELKTMLAETHVGWYHLLPAGMKIAAMVTFVTVAGLSTFLYFSQNPQIKFTPNEIINIVKPDTNKNEIPTIKEDTIKQDKKQSNSVKKDKSVSEHPFDNKSGDTVLPDKSESEIPAINVPQPDLEVNAGELEDKTLIPEPVSRIDGSASLMKNINKMVAVKTIKSNKYSFHYSFSEGALMLYGNFNANPYEILEINSSRLKEYFLFYNHQYYKLEKNTNSVSPLIEVTDTGLISELEVLKNNK